MRGVRTGKLVTNEVVNEEFSSRSVDKFSSVVSLENGILLGWEMKAKTKLSNVGKENFYFPKSFVFGGDEVDPAVASSNIGEDYTVSLSPVANSGERAFGIDNKL